MQPREGADAAIEGTTRETLTDQGGYFAFGGLADGAYLVRTEATERHRSAQAVLRAGVDSAVLVVTDQTPDEEAVVRGVVTDTSEQPLDAVRVLPIGSRSGATSTDQAGRFALSLLVGGQHDTYGLRFIKEGYRQRSLTLRPQELRDAGEITVNPRLEPINELATVTGVVMGDDGRRIQGASADLYAASVSRSYRATSDAAGAFVFHEVEVSGDYRLRVRPKPRAADRRRRGRTFKTHIEDGIDVPATGLDLTVVLKRLGEATLTGRMVNIHGEPISGFSMWLRPSEPRNPPFFPVTSDQNGAFVVDRVPKGPLSFQTRSASHLSVRGIDLASRRERVELVLDSGAYEAAGFVTDTSGSPVSGARVTLNWSYQRGMLSLSRRTTTADAQGYFLFTQLGPGAHTLITKAPGFRPARMPIRAVLGRSSIAVRLQRLPP